MHPTQNLAVDTTATPARTLRDAALYLTRHGWVQGAYYDATGGSFLPPACWVGAIGMVCYGGPVDAPAQNFDDPGFGDFEAAVAYLEYFLRARGLVDEEYGTAYDYNDAKDRAKAQVLFTLHVAADRWDADHEPGRDYVCPTCGARRCWFNGVWRCVDIACDAWSAIADPMQGGVA